MPIIKIINPEESPKEFESLYPAGMYDKDSDTISLIRGRYTPLTTSHEIAHGLYKHSGGWGSEHQDSWKTTISNEIEAWNWTYKKTGQPKHIFPHLEVLIEDLNATYNIPVGKLLQYTEMAIKHNNANQWFGDLEILRSHFGKS